MRFCTFSAASLPEGASPGPIPRTLGTDLTGPVSEQEA